ncbi:DUF6471 domain-containing protein [Roseovarius sp. MBR-154]
MTGCAPISWATATRALSTGQGVRWQGGRRRWRRLRCEFRHLFTKGVTYAQLVERLSNIGISEKEANVRNKLTRGKFSAAFLL